MARNSTDFKAVVLAGGSGERFWPLSTPQRPKQFLSVFGSSSLIRQSVERLEGLVKKEDVFIVTSRGLVDATRAELPEIPPGNIIGEPMRRDTGAAVALGVGLAGDGVVGFFSSDQLVAKPEAFREAVAKAIEIARSAPKIVTIGIKPDCPSTLFGYIDPATKKFIEKPNAEYAKKYVESGYLWNAGMFIAEAGTFRAAFAEHAPRLAQLASPETLREADLDAIYAALPRISFDFAVMEKFPAVDVVPGDFGWDDVGSYLAFDKYFPHDGDGNIALGAMKAVDSAGNIAVAKGARISLVGVKNLVVVTTGDDVLVADKASLSSIKKLFAK